MEPVLLIFNTDKFLIHAGDPKSFTWEVLDDYILHGFTLTTVTIDEYRKRNMTVYKTRMFIDFK